jgi:hypothetical protein
VVGFAGAAWASAGAAIRARAEPVPWPALHGAILRSLAVAGWLAALDQALVNTPSALALLGNKVKAALDRPELVRLPVAGVEGDTWWLSDPGGLGTALSDRVEESAGRLLAESGPLTAGVFSRLVYEQFPADLTPEPELLSACLHAYGREAATGFWQVRAEDRPEVREAERTAIVAGLMGLGHRLGYRAASRPPFDLAWSRSGQVSAVFAVRWQALLGEVLALAQAAPGVQPYLVIPGGRSALVSLKLARNPLWQGLVDGAHWRFVKYRHVRDLLAQPDVDEYTLRTIVGLDPIVEREAVQLALF